MVLLTIIDNKMMGVRAFLANSEVNLVPICFYLLGHGKLSLYKLDIWSISSSSTVCNRQSQICLEAN